jgi:LPPG:FO 2-phospho-L-lactate transferase
VLPVTDDPATTRVHTTDGRDLHFQEYWVRDRAAHPVERIELVGAERARPAPGVVEALLDADAVLVAPSNPVVSIGTVLAVPGVTEAVRQTRAPVVGVSPIVGGGVVRGMADRLLPAIGVPVSAVGVARHYREWLDGWVLDDEDAAHADAVRDLGVLAEVTDTMMDEPGVATALARTCLDLADQVAT